MSPPNISRTFSKVVSNRFTATITGGESNEGSQSVTLMPGEARVGFVQLSYPPNTPLGAQCFTELLTIRRGERICPI